MIDNFNGDNASLVKHIDALLSLDSDGFIRPNSGIGAVARDLLSSAASRLDVAPAAPAVIPPAMPHTHWTYCTPRDDDELKFVIVFEDADKPPLFMKGDESAAREKFARLEMMWTCHLFELAKREPSAPSPAVEQDASVLWADLVCRPYPSPTWIRGALLMQFPTLNPTNEQLVDISRHIGERANDDVDKMNRSDITYIPAGPALRKVRESSPVGHFLLDQQADTWQQVAPEHADDTDVIPLYRLKA